MRTERAEIAQRTLEDMLDNARGKEIAATKAGDAIAAVGHAMYALGIEHALEVLAETKR